MKELRVLEKKLADRALSQMASDLAAASSTFKNVLGLSGYQKITLNYTGHTVTLPLDDLLRQLREQVMRLRKEATIQGEVEAFIRQVDSLQGQVDDLREGL